MNYSKRHFVKFSDRTCRRPRLRNSPGPDGTNGQHVITSSVIMRRYEAADVASPETIPIPPSHNGEVSGLKSETCKIRACIVPFCCPITASTTVTPFSPWNHGKGLCRQLGTAN